MAIKLKNTDLKIVKGNTLIKSMMLGDKTIYGVAIQGPYIFSIQNNGATLTGITEIGKQLSVINIPPSYNGLTVKRIDNKAFDGCNNLTSIKIPNSVTSIGTWAFRNCIGLTSITIPNSVEFIDWGIIEGCDALTSITVDSSNSKLHSANNCIIETATKTLIIGCKSSVIPTDGSVTSIRWAAFQNCTGLTSMTIPNSVTSIGDSVFDGCTGLTSITIPNSVTSIGMRAFYGCFGLTTATIGSGVRSIGQEAFSTCTRLTSITTPNSVTSIGGSAFYQCSGLTSITLPFVGKTLDGTSATHFGYIFGASSYSDNKTAVPASLKTVEITGGTSIGENAFYGCSGLTSITIPSSVTSIGSQAFSGCSGLTSVTIPDSVIGIGRYAFSGTAWLNNQPNGLVYAGKVAYCYKGTMPQGTAITLRDGTIGIASSAFSGCDGLSSITIPDSVTSIDRYAFYDCSGLTAITVYAGNTTYKSVGNCIIERATSTLIAGCRSSVIPTDGSVTSIGISAFNNTKLTSIDIPNSVTRIGEWAFSHCILLTSITIPDSVTTIGHCAFDGCSRLKTINCEAASQPSGWDSDWQIGCNATVNWGYKGA